MSSPTAVGGYQADDREFLSPSPGQPSPGVITIADLLDEDDDDIEFEPSTQQSEDSDWVDEDDEDRDGGGDGDEYVGKSSLEKNWYYFHSKLIRSRCTR